MSKRTETYRQLKLKVNLKIKNSEHIDIHDTIFIQDA